MGGHVDRRPWRRLASRPRQLTYVEADERRRGYQRGAWRQVLRCQLLERRWKCARSLTVALGDIQTSSQNIQSSMLRSRLARATGRTLWAASLFVVVVETAFGGSPWGIFPAPVFYGALAIFFVGLWPVWRDLIAARRLGYQRVIEREHALQRSVDLPLLNSQASNSDHVT